MREVEKLCDRVMFIDHGRLVADDEPQKLARRFNFCAMQLVVPADMHQPFLRLCEKFNLQGEFEAQKFSCSILEDQCPEFLQQLISHGIRFDNITVTPPSLEDFFLSQVRNISQSAGE